MSTKLRLWSIQDVDILKDIKEKGFYFPQDIYTNACRDPETFKVGYDYMAENLIKKDKNKGDGNYPIWAFLQPIDLKFFGVKEDDFDLMEMELLIPEDRILLSGFGAYHAVLNNYYCPLNDEDYDEHCIKYYGSVDGNKLLPCYTEKMYDEVVKKSWINIFNIKETPKEDLQACFWKIYKEDIVSVTNIIGGEKSTTPQLIEKPL